MKRLLHRYKTWANKEPPTREQAYWAITLPWIAVGALAPISAIAYWRLGLAMAITFAVCVIVFTVALYWTDRRQGYMDAIHKHRMHRREEWLSEIESTKE